MAPAGWTAHGSAGDDPKRTEDDWHRLGRIDIRVGGLGANVGRVVWLFSDVAVGMLDVRRDENDDLRRAFSITADQVGWWNEVGRFAGVVVVVAGWAAAGLVGNSVYAAVKRALNTRVSEHAQALDTCRVTSPDSAVAMARWAICAEFHDSACQCVDTGRGHQPASAVWLADEDEDEEVPGYEFNVSLDSVRLQGISWVVELRERSAKDDAPSWNYRVEGDQGPAFFVAIAKSRPADPLPTVRSPSPTRPRKRRRKGAARRRK